MRFLLTIWSVTAQHLTSLFVKWRGWSSGLPGQEISHFLPRKFPTHPLPLCQFGGPVPGKSQQGPQWEKQDQRGDPSLFLHLKPAQSRGGTGRSPHLSEMRARETSTASSKHLPCFEERSKCIPGPERQKDGTNLTRSAGVFPELGRQLSVKMNTA